MIKYKNLIMIFGLLFIVGCTTSSTEDELKIKEIVIEASDYKFTPNEIILEKDEVVKLTIKSVDEIHGMTIPGLGISTPALKEGEEKIFTFVPERRRGIFVLLQLYVW